MRLKIMERDGFACRKCAAKDKTLHVHHHYYTKGAEPWEYDDEVLVTLCDDCHGQIEKASQQMKLAFGNLMVSNVCSLKCAVEAIAFMGNVKRHYLVDSEFKSPELFLEFIGHRAVDELAKDHQTRRIASALDDLGLLNAANAKYADLFTVDRLFKLNGKEVDL